MNQREMKRFTLAVTDVPGLRRNNRLRRSVRAALTVAVEMAAEDMLDCPLLDYIESHLWIRHDLLVLSTMWDEGGCETDDEVDLALAVLREIAPARLALVEELEAA